MRVLLIPLLASIVALSVVFYFGPYDWADAEPSEQIAAPTKIDSDVHESKSPELEPPELEGEADALDASRSSPVMVQVSPGEDPAGHAAAVAGIESFIEKQSDSEGRIRWTDPASGDERLVEFLGFHPEVYRNGNTWLRCADFRDRDGTFLDLDVVVMMRGDGKPASALLYHRASAAQPSTE